MLLKSITLLLLVTLASCTSFRFRPFGETDNQVVQANQDLDFATDAKPKFCNGLDCPAFTVISTNEDYEYRKYEASHWVTTELTGVDYDQASYTMFMRLFQYISGDNVAKQKIAMTCPVIVRIIPGQGPACENNFTMSFYVAPSMTNPPQPTDKTVYLSQMEEMNVYVRQFGGFTSKDKWLEEAKELGEKLPSTASYITDFYFTAGYDSPFKLFNRHNEIWFIETK